MCVVGYQHFGEACCLLNPEDGGRVFLHNPINFYNNTLHLIPKDSNLLAQVITPNRCGNLKWLWRVCSITNLTLSLHLLSPTPTLHTPLSHHPFQ